MTGTAGVASGTVSYQWQRRDQTTSIYTNISGATSQNYTPTVSTLLVTDTFFRRLTISNTGTTTCEEPSNVIQILVDNPPAATLSANINGSILTAAATATICTGEEVTFVANTVTGGSYEFLIDNIIVRPRADSNVYTTTALLANNSVTVRVYDLDTASAPAGCSADSDAINIVITPVPTLTVTSTALGNEICEGDAVTFFANASIASVTYIFRLNGVLLQNGLNQSFDPTAYGQTIQNGDVIEVEALTGVASCSTAITSITITENVISSAGTITTASPTICSGDTAPPLLGTDQSGTVSGTLSYQWQVSTDNNVTYSDIVFATSQNYTPTTVLTSDTFFRRKTISSTGTTTCEKISNVIRIQVDISPVASLSAIQRSVTTVASGTLNICVGEEIIFSAAPVTSGFTYEFTIDGVVVQARSNLSTFTSSSLANNENVRVEVFSGAVTDTTACSDLSERFNIQTLPTPIATLISNVIADTFCTGEEVIFTAGSNLASNSFEFFINGTSYQNSTTNIFNPSTLVPAVLLNDNDIVRVEVTSNPYSFASCSTVASLTLTENIIVTAGTISNTSLTICSGDTPAVFTETTVASATGTISYEWESGLDSVTFTAIPGSNSSTYTSGSLNQTTYFRRKAISTENGKACVEFSNVIEIRVIPPLAGGTITPANQTICSGQTPTILQVVGGSTGLAITYQWQESLDGILFTDIVTATSQDFTPPQLNTTRFYRRLVYAAGGGPPASCTEISSVTRIEVIDINPGALDPNQSVDYCYGATPPTIISSTTLGVPDDATSSAGTVTYRWQMRTDTTSWTYIASATNNFYNPPSLIESTRYRRIARATINAIDFCEETSNEIRIGILPDLNEGIVLGDDVICQIVSAFDLPANPLVLNGAETLTNSVTFQWQQSQDQYNWNDITGQQSETLTFNIGDSWLPTVPATYYRGIITYVGDPTPAALEQTVIEFVDEGNPIVGGQSYSIAVNGLTYTVVSSATSTIDSIAQDLATEITNNDFVVNATYNAAINMLTITPVVPGNYNVASAQTATDSGIAFGLPNTGRELNLRILVSGNTGGRLPNNNRESCQVYTDIATIEVLPQPTLRQDVGPASQNVCIGESITPITFRFGGGATSLEIRDLDPGLTITASGSTISSTIPNWYNVTRASLSTDTVITITGSVNAANTISFVTRGSGCTELTETHRINIIPNPITPDFIRMDVNAFGYEVLEHPAQPGVWFNNTVCQDNIPAPTTPSSEFFACYLNDALNRQFVDYLWTVSPTNAGAFVPNNFQETTVGLLEVGSGPTTGVTYLISLTASATTNTYTFVTTVASQSVDIIGLELATQVDANPNVRAIYNNIDDEIIIESLFANTAFTVTVSPTGVAQNVRLVPPATRQIVRSGTVNWNPNFNGRAFVQVRSVGCDADGDGNPDRSGPLTVAIDVVPEALVATPTASDLLEPDAFNYQVCGGAFTGEIPNCQIIATTPDTQFFTASDNGANPNEFDRLEWQISNPQPGAGSPVNNPGTIDQATGIMSWTVGWWGSFELQVRPISCSGVAGNWKSRTIYIGPQDGPITSVTPVGANALPLCPIPAGGFSTSLTTGGASVRWFVNSPAGLAATTTFVASNTFFELPPTNSNSDTVELNFRPGFFGNIIVSAEPTPCPGERVNYVISIPGPPQINLTSGFNSNNQILCNNTALNTITYDIEGAADLVTAINLPTGVNFVIDIVSQQTSISIGTVTSTQNNRNYSLSINNQRFDFSTTGIFPNAAQHIGQGLASAVNSATTDFVATYSAGTISIEVGPTGQPGSSFIISTTAPVNSAVNFGAPTTQPLSKTVSIFGTPSITGTGVFVYNLVTQAPQAGCETRTTTGTIQILEDASISVVQGTAMNTGVCGVSDFNGLNAIIMEFEGTTGGIQLSPSSPNNLPNGLFLNPVGGGVFNQYQISGNMSQVVTTTTQWDVDFETFGANCNDATQRITFIIEPSPIASLTSTASLGTDRTVCASDTMIPIRFEIGNPAFTLTTTGTSAFPNGVTGVSYAQNQIMRVRVMLDGSPTLTSNLSDTFTINVNGTPYQAEVGDELPSASHNITQLVGELSTYLSGQLSPTFTVRNADPFIEFESNAAGVAFTVSALASSHLIFDTVETTQPPAYYEISGTPTPVLTPTTFNYFLQSVGPGGNCSGSYVASGTITVNPTTSAAVSPLNPGAGQNPNFCDVGVVSSTLYQAVGSPIAITRDVITPAWITATLDPILSTVRVDFAPPVIGVTSIQTFTYSFNLIGNGFGCTTSPAPITGVVSISPNDRITFNGAFGDNAQTICVNNGATLPSFTPIEYILSGGATTVNTITYRQDGGPVQSGLPPGFGYTVVGNVVQIVGMASAAAASPTAPSTTYEYNIQTGPGACLSDNATGTIEVVSNPTLVLDSATGTDNQVICAGTGITPILYEMGGGTNNVSFTWTGSNSLFGLGITAANIGPNLFSISGTPTVNVTQTTVYNYQIETVGSNCAPEVVLTGSIQIDPLDSISLISSPTTDNQTVCYLDQDNAGNAISEPFIPIEYQLGGGAIGQYVTVQYSVNGSPFTTGLPSGLGFSVTPSNTVLISGSISASTTFTTPTVTYTYQITTNGACATDTITGNLTVNSIPVMSLVSSVTTENQVICDATAIDDIVYEIAGGATTFDFSWIGSNTLDGTGLSRSNSGTNQYIISGIPTTNVTQTTVYNYQIETMGSACIPEVIRTGSIEIRPADIVTLVSTPTSDNQSICLLDNDNPANAIAELFIPIEYQLAGGAIGQPVNFAYRINGGAAIPGLPSGLGYTTTLSNTVIINGTINVSTTFTTPTVVYTYEMTTSGNCVTNTVTGDITVHSPPVFTRTSAATSTNQIGYLSVCDLYEPIGNIVYTFGGGATNAVFSWTSSPLIGVNGNIAPGTNDLVIQGTPSMNLTSTTLFTYEVRTENSACAPEIVYTGTIEVNPEETLTLASASSTVNQQICAGTGTNTLTPIVYTLGQEATSAVLTTSPNLPGISANVSGSQVIISGFTTASAQASKTISVYNYQLTTTGCGPAVETGTIEVLPLPVMELYQGNPNQPSVCNQSDIASVTYVFNEESNGIPSQVWTVNGTTLAGTPPGFGFQITSILGGTNNAYRLIGTPNVNVSQTTTYNYEITLSATCDPDVVYQGSVTVDPGPIIDVARIQNTMVTNVSCYGASDGSIILGNPSDPSFLNAITNLQLGLVQRSEIAFSGTVTYTDIIRVTVNGTEYSARGGEVRNGVPTAFLPNDIMADLITQINNDPGQNVLNAGLNGFGIRLVGNLAGTIFTYSANTTDTNAITNVPTTTQVAESYAPELVWTFPDSRVVTSTNIGSLEAGVYYLEVINGACSSVASFTVTEPPELTATFDTCAGGLGTIYVNPTGGLPAVDGTDYTFTIMQNGIVLSTKVDSGQISFSTADNGNILPGGNYSITVTDLNSCTFGQAISLPQRGFVFNPANIIQGNSYCSSSTIVGTGYIETLYQVGGGTTVNAITGGSGIYDYAWRREPASAVISTSPNIYNLAPGWYSLTVTDTTSAGCFATERFEVLGYDPLVISAIPQPPFFTPDLSNQVDYIYELNCIGDTNGTFTLAVQGASGSLSISSAPPLTISGNVVSGAGPGTYVFTVVDNNPPIDPLTGLPYTPCVNQLTVRVEEPQPVFLNELVDERIQPNCQADIANGRLVFEIVNFNLSRAPYSVQFNGGIKTISTTNSRVVVDNINVGVPAERVITSIEITDANGCPTPITNMPTPLSEVREFNVFQIVANDISCGDPTSGDVTVTIPNVAGNSPITSTDPVQINIIGRVANYNFLGTIEDNNPFTNIPNLTQQGTYDYIITATGSASGTCIYAQGSFDVDELTGSQFEIAFSTQTPDRATCENVITLTTTGTIAPVTVEWEVFTPGVGWVEYGSPGEHDGKLILSGVPPGTYRATVEDNRTSVPGCVQNPLITRGIIIPENLTDLREDTSLRFTPSCPEDLARGGELAFEIVNATVDDPTILPWFTVILNGDPSIIATSGNTNRVLFAGTNSIDVTLNRFINSAEIIDNNGCSKTVSLSISYPEIFTYTSNVTTNDIDCSTGTEGLAIIEITPNDPIGRFSPQNPGFIEIQGRTNRFAVVQTVTNTNSVPVTITQAGIYDYVISANGTNTCEVATGTFEIFEISNSQISATHTTTLRGCYNSESNIELILQNVITPYTIRWERWTETANSITVSITGTQLTLTQPVFEWTAQPDYDNLTIITAPPGRYRATIVDGRNIVDPLSSCSTNTFITSQIVIDEAPEVRLVEAEDLRITPTCPDDLIANGGQGARVYFTITNFDVNKAPYNVILNNGDIISAPTSVSSISIDIDVTDSAQRSITSAVIVDRDGCATEEQTLDIVFPFVHEYDVNVSSTDIDCAIPNSGQISFEIFSRTDAGRLTQVNQGQLYIVSRDGSYETYRTLNGDVNPVIVDLDRAGTYDYTISLNGTTTCLIDSGDVTISDSNNDELTVDVDVVLPGCGVEGSRITLDVNGFVAPLSIVWYKSEQRIISQPVTRTTPNGNSTVTYIDVSSTVWVDQTQADSKFQNNPSVVNDLDSGIYRAIVSDNRASDCGGGEFITRNITIAQSSFTVNNFRVVQNIPPVGNGQCTNYNSVTDQNLTFQQAQDLFATSDVFFSLDSNIDRTQYTGINFTLIGPDGQDVIRDVYGLQIPTFERSFRFTDLIPGRYTLEISENVTQTAEPCTELFFFTVEDIEPIRYTGDTVFVTDICTGAVLGGIQASAAGGEPFVINGVPSYQYEWTYTPNDPGASSQVFYGDRVDPAYPGRYCLRIIDRNGYSFCSCDDSATSIPPIVVEDVVQPFTVVGNLTDPDNLGTVVKSLPPDCSSGGLNGQISVLVNGGQLPYTISWFAEDPRYLTQGLSGYRPLDGSNGGPDFTNRTTLDGLLPGNYKMVISSQADLGCNGTNQYTQYEEIIQVSPNRELYIMDGPYVDEDLCTGQQGRLIVDIFDNNNGNLSFYYNDILIPNSDVVRLSDRSWSVAIVNAVESADFRIVNEEGCWITTEINRGIGEPNFTYSSPNFEGSSVILAREEITFENTSTDPYVTSEWIFGDNTPPEVVPTLVDSIIPVRHTYGISGTYFTTLRIYNDIGCSEEITIPIAVGKGYNIMVPNVFTPNNDLVNDYFRPLFSGFRNMTFTVYDYRGNVVYNEYAEEADPNNIQGISITGWDGSLAPFSPYFIYTAYGVLLDGETEVEKSGTFIIIN